MEEQRSGPNPVNARRRLADLLDDVASGFVTVREALRQIHAGEWDEPELWTSEEDERIRQLLEQMEIDEELRARDREYAANQNRQLESLARWLRSTVTEERPPESTARRAARIARWTLLVVAAGVLSAVAVVGAFELWEAYRKRWPLTDDQNGLLIIALIAASVVFWAALSLEKASPAVLTIQACCKRAPATAVRLAPFDDCCR